MARNNCDPDYNPSNREKAQRAKKGLFWCGGCDCNMVGKLGKCTVCGWKADKDKKRKKDS